ncbi:MAG: hypothetical protein JXQ73_02870 [Phycisphaerae bacterium]|nr:hypothetical protein [Phycisphaerae bacterium]
MRGQVLGVLAVVGGIAVSNCVGLTTERADSAVTVKGDHFSVTIDLKQGGEVTDIRLFDGAQWNSILTPSSPAITLPGLALRDKQGEYLLAKDSAAELVDLKSAADKVSLTCRATPRTADGKASPWRVTTSYEVYPEGAVFIDLDCCLEDKAFMLSRASVSFAVAEAIHKAPKYRDQNVGMKTGGFKSARVAFGMSEAPGKSFTNEIELIVEQMTPMAGKVDYAQTDGRFTWTLGGGDVELKAPYRYRNRLSLALGSAVSGRPRSTCVGQRVYHWVNWLDKRNWYPTDEQIDKMVANHATMLVLHHEYLLQRGSNGYPHADYGVARDHGEMVRMIEHAHKRGLRVGLYMRGVEWYALGTKFFETYCKRDWDGIYADWHGPHAVSWHENRYRPETKLGDKHFSEKGLYVPAKEYFLFTRRLRDVVGPNGFLIGHQGSFNSGIFANLCFDAFLPGETGSDRTMFASLDEAAYKGMLGGGVCMPWMLDLPRYRNAEGMAKMAAWGFYPHLVMGIVARHTKNLTFPLDPDDKLYAYILPYWRVLSKIDVEKATVFNLPSQNVVVVRASNPDFQSTVYKEGQDTYLLITANLGSATAKATLTLEPKVLGMSGEYEVVRIDPATGQTHPCGKSAGVVTTSDLPQWGIEGFKLKKK